MSKSNGERCYEQVKKCKCIIKERELGPKSRTGKNDFANDPYSEGRNKYDAGPPQLADPCESLDFNDPIFCGRGPHRGPVRGQPSNVPPPNYFQPTYSTPRPSYDGVQNVPSAGPMQPPPPYEPQQYSEYSVPQNLPPSYESGGSYDEKYRYKRFAPVTKVKRFGFR